MIEELIFQEGIVAIPEGTSGQITHSLTEIATEIEKQYSVDVDMEVFYTDTDTDTEQTVIYWFDEAPNCYIQLKMEHINAFNSRTEKYYRMYIITYSSCGLLEQKILEDFFNVHLDL